MIFLFWLLDNVLVPGLIVLLLLLLPCALLDLVDVVLVVDAAQ